MYDSRIPKSTAVKKCQQLAIKRHSKACAEKDACGFMCTTRTHVPADKTSGGPLNEKVTYRLNKVNDNGTVELIASRIVSNYSHLLL
jgi:hypothetical protein